MTTVYTPLSKLPEQFTYGPLTRQMSAYVERRWKRAAHGWYQLEQGKAISYGPEFIPAGSSRISPDHYRWVENASAGLRVLSPCHEYIDLNHTGWFIDPFQDETVHGVLVQLPGTEGHPVYCLAVSDPNNDDCYVIDFRSTFDDKKECAQSADMMAQYWAEHERDYQVAEHTKERLAEIDAEIKGERAGLLTLVRTLRANCDKLSGEGMKAVRDAIREHIATVRETCDELAWERTRIEREGIEF